jgi:hypothetical protein
LLGTSHTAIHRFERGLVKSARLDFVGALCAVVGLEMSIKTYPAGDPIRDRAQLALLERFRAQLHPALRRRTEVPLPIEFDLRAWDAVITAAGPPQWRIKIEAETNISDGQALERRLALKARDDPEGLLVLLVSDTVGNRRALRTLRAGTRELLPLDTRQIMLALRAGRQPAGSGIVIL